jgi:ATP-dependent RNA helicase DDX5/DBP2
VRPQLPPQHTQRDARAAFVRRIAALPGPFFGRASRHRSVSALAGDPSRLAPSFAHGRAANIDKMIAKPPSAKKAKKLMKQRLAAEANAARAEAFMAAKREGRDPSASDDDESREKATRKTKKRRAGEDSDADAAAAAAAEDSAHDALEAALAEGGVALAKRSKKLKKTAEDAPPDDKAARKAAKKLRRAAALEAGREDAPLEGAPAADPRSSAGDDDPSATEPPSSAARAALVASFRAEHAIKVAEPDPPDPVMRFEDAPFARRLVQALLKQGYEAPTPIQAQAWPLAVRGRDVVAVAKTGSGKTCGFLLPALHLILKRGACAAPDMEMVDGRFRPAAVVPSAFVLAPTRELAIQIGDECGKFCPAAGAKTVTLYGGASKGDQLRALRTGADVIVATPGRLNDFLAPPPGFSAPVRATNASYVVLDEADRMLDMGFEPQIRKILRMCPSARQTLMFTATWPEAVRKIAEQFTKPDAAHVRIGDGGERLTANRSVAQTVEVLDEDAKLDRAVAVLRHHLGGANAGARGIVFCGTKRRCDFIDRKIKAAGLRSAGAIHGDKDQAEREYALDLFRKGKAPLLVATDVAARGLDIPNIALVLVYDFPMQTEDYVHRIGRTGRAGAKGAAHCFFTEENAGQARELVRILEGAEQDVPDALREMAERRRGGGRGGRGGGRGGRGRGRGSSFGRGGGRGAGRGGGRGKW